ncbi:MAG: nitroreductase family protein [Oscillospiraceae bacterium]|jgi:nitroreductase
MFYELLKSRRSVRKFLDREMEKEKIDLILKSALLSPSSRARRPWEFIVVTDRNTLNKLSKCREHSSGFLSGAPAGIVVAADTELTDVWTEDASIASIIIQLAAQSLGLGSCWIQVRQRPHDDMLSAGEYVKQVLNIPEKYAVESIIALGYPAGEMKPYDEKELRYEKIHYGEF